MIDGRDQFSLVSSLPIAQNRLTAAKAGWVAARDEHERAVIAVAVARLAQEAPSAESLLLEESDQGDFYMVQEIEGPGRRWTRAMDMDTDDVEDSVVALSSENGAWLGMLVADEKLSRTARRLYLEDAVLFAAGAKAEQLHIARQYGISQTVELDVEPVEVPTVAECIATNTTSGSGDVQVQAYMFADSHTALGRPVLWVDRESLQRLVDDGMGDPGDRLSAGGNAEAFIDLTSEPPATVDDGDRARVTFEVRQVEETRVYGLHDWDGLDVDGASIKEVTVITHTTVRRTSIEGVSTSPSVPGVGMHDPAAHVHALRR